jgi:DNA (cytosine-5)-methyltransferase 1
MRAAVVDLFCGVGGLTCGLKKAKLNVVAGIDNDPTCKYAYETNNEVPFFKEDISNFSSEDLLKLFGKADIKILVGCAPCQRFSKQASKYLGTFDRKTDKTWNLLKSFAKYIQDIEPDIVSMENVPELSKYDVFQEFEKILRDLEYWIDWHIVDCGKYGLPQKRKRLVLLASKLGEIKLLPSDDERFEEKRSVYSAIGGLRKIRHGQSDAEDLLHRCAGLTEINMKRMRQSKPGGTWRDWDESLLPNCYRKETGKTYSSVYGRMRWDEPSPTITTQFYSFGTGRYGHPEQNRALSLREGALLQTFPKDYKFFADIENMSISTISRHIGNAVPVDLGKIIGISIKEHIKGIKKCRKLDKAN